MKLGLIFFSLSLYAICSTLYAVPALAVESCFVCNQGIYRSTLATNCTPSSPACEKDKNVNDTCQSSDDLTGQICDTNHQKPTDVSTPPTTPPTEVKETQDEQTMQTFNSLLPNAVKTDIKPEPSNIFTDLKDKLQSLFDNLFGFRPKTVETYSPRSYSQNKSENPAELQTVSKSDDKGDKRLENAKQNADPVFDNTLPFKKDELKKTCQKELAYQQSYFPTGVTPVTQCTGQ